MSCFCYQTGLTQFRFYIKLSCNHRTRHKKFQYTLLYYRIDYPAILQDQLLALLIFKTSTRYTLIRARWDSNFCHVLTIATLWWGEKENILHKVHQPTHWNVLCPGKRCQGQAATLLSWSCSSSVRLVARNISHPVFMFPESLFVGHIGPGLNKNPRIHFYLRAETPNSC